MATARNLGLSGAILAGLALAGGCETLYLPSGAGASNERQEAARMEMARQQAARDLGMLKAQSEATAQNIQRLDARLDRLENEMRQGGSTRTELDALRRDVDQLRAERAQLRREIVDELSREMSRLLAAQNTSATSRGSGDSSTGRQAGWEHKVQAGQTLSEIAKAYNTTVERIQRANNMKNDVIRVGQVLFIPE